MDLILVAQEQGIARVVLNRPERRNALSLAMLEELGRVVTDLGADPTVRVVVIAGAGPVFSAGHDLAEMIDRDEAFYAELFDRCTEAMLRLHAIPQPVIAQVHGVATAAGCQLVAACDLAIATDDCRFATPGVRIGLFCSTPMVPITRAIGRKRAMQMLLTGDAIDADTAVAWGLINAAVPAAGLADAVTDLAGRIMEHSSAVIGIGKEAFYRQVDEPETAAYAITSPVMSDNAAHVDAQEGMAAFHQKRTPQWPSQFK
ncbi:MAG: enoyl-CoA hydratase [Acidimicrobiia bacterium]|nr:enoyl-CoA hydratase [Acidimicrobiia bacterium]